MADMSTLAFGAVTWNLACGRAEADSLDTYVDPAAFLVNPRIRVLNATLQRWPRDNMGWPGRSYDYDKHLARYRAVFDMVADRVGADLDRVNEVVTDQERLNALIARVKENPPDALLLTFQDFAWQWLDPILDIGVPTIVFAPIGTAFVGQIDEHSRRNGIYVVSSLEAEAVEKPLKMVRAFRCLADTRILVVAGDYRRDGSVLTFGTRLKFIPARDMYTLYRKMPVSKEVKELARKVAGGAVEVVEPSRSDVINAVRSYTAIKRLMRDEGCNAVTTNCLGMVRAKHVPTPPCLAASLLLDRGIIYGCEADIRPAMALLLVRHLFNQPGFMNDPVPETVHNTLVVAHCTSATRLDGFTKEQAPYRLRSHSETDIGVSMEVHWREGTPITMIHFNETFSELLVDTGSVVRNITTPPAGGCRTSFEVKIDNVEDSRNVTGYHQVLFYGNHLKEIKAFCQLYGIQVKSSTDCRCPDQTRS